MRSVLGRYHKRGKTLRGLFLNKHLWILSLWLCFIGHDASAVRLKDLADLKGARANHLIGYGLIVGLAGTGDDASASFSTQSVVAMLQRLGVKVDASQLRVRNVAAVMVTASLPAYMAAGQRLDVTVSSVGNASSLQGGTLLTTPLKGADLKVYAVAQGPVLVGGYAASGSSGSSAQKNHTTVGRVPRGALIEREIDFAGSKQKGLSISLREPDFTTAVRIAKAIEKELETIVKMVPPPSEQSLSQQKSAEEEGEQKDIEIAEPRVFARDAGTVVLQLPSSDMAMLPPVMAHLEALQIEPDRQTRVVINERTGTVVLGEGVQLKPVAIAHGGLTLEVQETPVVSQPEAFSRQGQTEVVPRSQVRVSEVAGDIHNVKGGASLGDVVQALNAIGVKPRDLVAILQALKASGALQAELEIQ